MPDDSHLDLKYFVDDTVYNCPFCNRRHVTYEFFHFVTFDWTSNKRSYALFVKCKSCGKRSMRLSYIELVKRAPDPPYQSYLATKDLDSKIFYSVPTSFAVLDERMPAVVRELISEGESCLKLNLLTGASACLRKAIYELLEHEKAQGNSYENRIKALKLKHPDADPTGIDVLSHIQGMTSDKVHEQSWPKWDASNLKLISESLKSVLHDLYVIPQQRLDRAKEILRLKQQVAEGRKNRAGATVELPAELVPIDGAAPATTR